MKNFVLLRLGLGLWLGHCLWLNVVMHDISTKNAKIKRYIDASTENLNL